MVKVSCHSATSPLLFIAFARWHGRAHLLHLVNTTELVHADATWRERLNVCFLEPTQVHNPNDKSIGSTAFAHAHGRKSLDFTMGAPCPLNCPYPRGSGPHLTQDSMDPSDPTTLLDHFSRFSTDDRRVSLYFTMVCPFPSKSPLLMGGSGSPSNTWFPGPTWVLNPNGTTNDSHKVKGQGHRVTNIPAARML